MRGRDGGAGGGAPLAEGAIGVGAAGAGGQGAGGAGRQLARQLDGALTLALPAPVELGRGLHRHRPLVGRAGAGAARAGIDVRGAVVHRHAAAHQVRPPGPRRRLFPRPRFLAGGPLPRRATRGADLDHLEIPPGALPPYQRYDVRHADAADRPTDASYDRYVYLAVTFREHDYDDRALISQRLFCVEPPLFNAIYLWSELALAEIAKLVGAEEGPHLAAAGRIRQGIVRRLWDPEQRRFLPWDARTQRRIHKASVDAAMPLLDPELPEPMVTAIVEELRSPHFDPPSGMEHFLIPSYDLHGRGFDRRRYWRGPVWINTDWLVWRGLRQHGETALAGEVEDSMVGLVRCSGFREYYDPFGAQGYGSDDFSWTAALLLDVLGNRAGGLSSSA